MNLLLQVCFLVLIFVRRSIYPKYPQVKQVDSTVEAGAQFQQVDKIDMLPSSRCVNTIILQDGERGVRERLQRAT